MEWNNPDQKGSKMIKKIPAIVCCFIIIAAACTQIKEEASLLLKTNAIGNEYKEIGFTLGDPSARVFDQLQKNDIIIEVTEETDYKEILCFGEAWRYTIVLYNDSLSRIEADGIDGRGVVLPKSFYD